MIPMSGINANQYHHPERSVSCSRLTVTEMYGRTVTIPKIEAKGENSVSEETLALVSVTTVCVSPKSDMSIADKTNMTP